MMAQDDLAHGKKVTAATRPGREMTPNFFERPILNSPFETPRLHHALDADGQPSDAPPVEGRRRSELITPVPRPRKRKNKSEQGKLALGDKEGLSTAEQEYNPTPIINEIRSHVASWRDLPNAAEMAGYNAMYHP
jgi:type III restriction enzyme